MTKTLMTSYGAAAVPCTGTPLPIAGRPRHTALADAPFAAAVTAPQVPPRGRPV